MEGFDVVGWGSPRMLQSEHSPGGTEKQNAGQRRTVKST